MADDVQIGVGIQPESGAGVHQIDTTLESQVEGPPPDPPAGSANYNFRGRRR